jgi:hypothetical protein
MTNPEDILSDECLQMLGLLLPSGEFIRNHLRETLLTIDTDPQGFKDALVDCVAPDQADHIFKHYGHRLLNVCTSFSMRER